MLAFEEYGYLLILLCLPEKTYICLHTYFSTSFLIHIILSDLYDNHKEIIICKSYLICIFCPKPSLKI